MAGVGRDFKDPKVLTSCHGQDQLSHDQVDQSSIQPALDHIQGWDIHHFSGQPVAVSHHAHSNNIFLMSS